MEYGHQISIPNSRLFYKLRGLYSLSRCNRYFDVDVNDFNVTVWRCLQFVCFLLSFFDQFPAASILKSAFWSFGSKNLTIILIFQISRRRCRCNCWTATVLNLNGTTTLFANSAWSKIHSWRDDNFETCSIITSGYYCFRRLAVGSNLMFE